MILGSSSGAVPLPNKNNSSVAFGGGVVGDVTGLGTIPIVSPQTIKFLLPNKMFWQMDLVPPRKVFF